MKSRKPAPRIERGEWRPFYELLVDDPDWTDLSPDARLLWMVCKLRAGAAGIRLIPALHHCLSKWTGMPLVAEGPDRAPQEPREGPSRAPREPLRRLENATTELVRAGRIEIEGDILWVRNGLKFEPTLHPDNEYHRAHILRTVNSLPRSAIVRRFCEAEARWFDSLPKGLAEPLKSPSRAPTITTPTPTPKPTTTHIRKPAADTSTKNGAAGGWPAAVATALGRLGPVAPGHLGKKLKALHAAHGEALLVKAAEAYVTRALEQPVDKGHQWGTARFLRETGYWIEYVTPGGGRKAVGDLAPAPAPAIVEEPPSNPDDPGFLH